MSAVMFAPKHNHHQHDNYSSLDHHSSSRIPVLSTSPLPFGRSNSLRLKGEKRCNFVKFSNDDADACSTPLNNGMTATTTAHPRSRRDENGMRDVRNSLNHHSRSTTTTTSRIESLSLSNTKLHSQKSPTISLPSTTPPTSPYGTQSNYNHRDWDLESIGSTTSNLSLSSCDHAAIARNGTTFSGRSMRYIFHCNQNSAISGEEYLTPTQRAHRQIKKLKSLLHQAQVDLEQKDSDIYKLTKEVVELRLYKAAICSPEDRSNSSDAVTVRELNSDEQITPESTNGVEETPNNSYVDSGHFEDSNPGEPISKQNLESSSVTDKSVDTCDFGDDIISEQKIIEEYERRIQELIKAHEEDNCQMKQKHNDKIEELLVKIGDINQRYWQIVPELEAARERIKDLEKQLEESCKKLEDLEKKHQETKQELESPGISKVDTQVMDIAKRNPSRLSVPELLQELQVTKNELENLKDTEYASTSNNLQPLLSAKEALSLWVLGARKAMYRQLMEAKNKNKIDPEITLQFLKSAIYYFLTDKENTAGHLRAIQSILGFSQSEISNIDKAQFQ